MAGITPRWEWRSFGRRFGRAETLLAGLEAEGVQESDEIYLLAATGSNVKIRDALLDIKLLRKVDATGLEQWMPVTKARFPLSAATVAEVFKALDVPAPPLARGDYTLEQFLTELVGRHAAVRAVKVHKRRVRYTVGGCMAELAEVEVDGRKTRTIAIENEDADAVLAAVRSLGLAGRANTNYLRGLAAIAGGGLRR
jgi:exopolyphosphatase/guanosine-5'-triphosphate,3'-diphosphate pyrophosphatase